MKREEKNLQTRQKIIERALLEFGEKSYGEASLNAVCAKGGVSKGIIYHYFKDKDELYLLCVRDCFDALTRHLSSAMIGPDVSIETALKRYFDARGAFFESHPPFLKLFYNAAISPPNHLAPAIAQLRVDFDALNLSVLTRLLETAGLRPDIALGEVVAVFRAYQDFVSTRFQMRAVGNGTLQEYEEQCRRSLKALLYGVIDRRSAVL